MRVVSTDYGTTLPLRKDHLPRPDNYIPKGILKVFFFFNLLFFFLFFSFSYLFSPSPPLSNPTHKNKQKQNKKQKNKNKKKQKKKKTTKDKLAQKPHTKAPKRTSTPSLMGRNTYN